jgi:hypothetical protein
LVYAVLLARPEFLDILRPVQDQAALQNHATVRWLDPTLVFCLDAFNSLFGGKITGIVLRMMQSSWFSFLHKIMFQK